MIFSSEPTRWAFINRGRSQIFPDGYYRIEFKSEGYQIDKKSGKPKMETSFMKVRL